MASDSIDSKVTLTKPPPGEAVSFSVRPGQTYILDFSLESATLSDKGQDLELLFDDGSGMLLRGFCAAVEQDDLYLELPDGVMLSGKDVVDAVRYDLKAFQPSGGGPPGELAALFPDEGGELDALLAVYADRVPDPARSMTAESPPRSVALQAGTEHTGVADAELESLLSNHLLLMSL